MLNFTAETKFRINLALFASVLSGAGWLGYTFQDVRSSMRDLQATAAETAEKVTGNVRKMDEAKAANSKQMDELASRVGEIQAKLATLEVTIADRFTKTAAAEWALRIQLNNPTLRIPDPREPSQMLGHP